MQTTSIAEYAEFSKDRPLPHRSRQPKVAVFLQDPENPLGPIPVNPESTSYVCPNVIQATLITQLFGKADRCWHVKFEFQSDAFLNGFALSNRYISGVAWLEGATLAFLAHNRWDEITGKPELFPPAAHSHTWDSIGGKPSTFTPSAHNHPWNEVSGKPEAFPPASHTHSWDSVSGKPSSFTPSAHSHSWDSVSGKPEAFPPAAHSHTAGGALSGDLSNLSLADGSVTAAKLQYSPYGLKGRVYLTSGTGTYTPSTGVRAVDFELFGPGGGGGGVSGGGAGTAAAGVAGGGGAYCRKFITNLAQSFTYTIGTPGTGGTSGNHSATGGSATTLVCSITGTLSAGCGGNGTGMAGTSGSALSSGADGGVASGGDVNLSGDASGARAIVTGVLASVSRSGGAPYVCGAVRATSPNNDGTTPTQPGAGGTGAAASNISSNYSGGTGGPGLIVVSEFY